MGNFEGYYSIKEMAIGISQGLYNKTVEFFRADPEKIM